MKASGHLGKFCGLWLRCNSGDNTSLHGIDVTAATFEPLGKASINCQVLAALQMRHEAPILEEDRIALRDKLKKTVERWQQSTAKTVEAVAWGLPDPYPDGAGMEKLVKARRV